MAYSCDIEYEVAVITDSTSVALSFTTTETALVSSQVTQTALAILIETAVVLGEGRWIAPGDLFEAAVVTGDATPTTNNTNIVYETAVVGSAVYPPSGVDVYETAAITGDIFSVTANTVTEEATLDDAISASRRATNIVLETAVALGVVLGGGTNTVVDTAVILGDAIPGGRLIDIAYEVAELGDLTATGAVAGDTVDEVANLDDSTTLFTHGVNIAGEEGFVTGYAIVGYSGDAWVSTPLNPAMSRYEGLLSTELLPVGREFVGLSDAGMYALTNDGVVPSEILTGIEDFNDPQRRIDGSYRKHVMWVYAISAAEAAYTLRVMTDDEGTPVERVYAFPFASGPHIRNTRCQLGKRTWARYWQFAFMNDEPHTLSGSHATIELTSRRA